MIVFPTNFPTLRRKLTRSLIIVFVFTIYILFLRSVVLAKSFQTIRTNLHAQTIQTRLDSILFESKAQDLSGLVHSSSDFCVDAPVLLYHHIQPLYRAQKNGNAQLTVDDNYFDQQMEYISSHYQTFFAEDLVESLRTNRTLSNKPIIVTLDDGYDDAYLYAFPIFKRYNVKATLFIPPGLLNKDGYLTTSQLREMTESGLVAVYNHTYSHLQLTMVPKEIAEYDIKRGEEELFKMIGHKSPIFSYPYGSSSPEVVEVLKEHGYQGAFTTDHGYKQCQSELMTLHRDHVANMPLSFYGL